MASACGVQPSSQANSVASVPLTAVIRPPSGVHQDQVMPSASDRVADQDRQGARVAQRLGGARTGRASPGGDGAGSCRRRFGQHTTSWRGAERTGRPDGACSAITPRAAPGTPRTVRPGPAKASGVTSSTTPASFMIFAPCGTRTGQTRSTGSASAGCQLDQPHPFGAPADAQRADVAGGAHVGHPVRARVALQHVALPVELEHGQRGAPRLAAAPAGHGEHRQLPHAQAQPLHGHQHPVHRLQPARRDAGPRRRGHQNVLPRIARTPVQSPTAQVSAAATAPYRTDRSANSPANSARSASTT